MTDVEQQQPRRYTRAFALGVALNAGFVAIEFVYGVMADSLALIADAGHNLSDVLSLLLAWGAAIVAGRAPTKRYTYGFRRATILAALLSALLLLVALGAITWEAIGRLTEPREVQGATVLAVAVIGVFINTATALLFLSGREHDLNIKAAFLHMAADAAVSLGVVVAAIAIMTTGWLWLDPALSLAIVVVVFLASWGLLRDSLRLSLDAVPAAIDLAEVEAWLGHLPGVQTVHDLHVWAMSTTENALTVHLVMPQTPEDAFLGTVSDELARRFQIHHCTVQVERDTPSRVCKQE